MFQIPSDDRVWLPTAHTQIHNTKSTNEKFTLFLRPNSITFGWMGKPMVFQLIHLYLNIIIIRTQKNTAVFHWPLNMFVCMRHMLQFHWPRT